MELNKQLKNEKLYISKFIKFVRYPYGHNIYISQDNCFKIYREDIDDVEFFEWYFDYNKTKNNYTVPSQIERIQTLFNLDRKTVLENLL